MKIIGIVSLYNPSMDNIEAVNKCAPYFDTFLAIDDSEMKQEINISKTIQYKWNGENIGLCRSINRGINEAIKLDADWILILDQDSIMNPTVLNVYKSFISTESTALVALISPQSNYDRHIRKARKGYRYIRFSHLSGSLINVRVLKKIGLFDERFFVDCLDNEWCLRALKNGYKIVECKEAVLDHHPAHTKQIRVCNKVIFSYGQDTPERYYYQFRGFRLLHNMYHDFGTDLFGIYKFFKSMLLFENRDEYKKMWDYAKEDYESGYFGRYQERL